ncbi:MAG: hypothetical protein II050_05630, partial [Bacteroidaceae bacterium]|nr:hypothetical protein [Bacteroidaceae bacterium]
ILLEPALEGAVTDSSGSGKLILEITSHLSFLLIYYSTKLQNKYEFRKKIHYRFWTIIDNNRQR